jgi:nucleotide-binding universal stress UspA family protein
MSTAAIAVAVDGTPSSRTALLRAAGLAREQGRPLRGVHVLDDGWVDYIGNDWQSSAGARQGFLDYVRRHAEAQAEAARQQFDELAGDFPAASFSVICGDPLDALCDLMREEVPAMLVLADDAFQVCGRPSVRRLAADLPRRVHGPVLVVSACG